MLVLLGISCAAASVGGPPTIEVDPSYFIRESLIEDVALEEHTLSGGTKAMCYVIKTRSKPHEHAMGPWAPRTLTDDKEAGGIWFKDGKVYDVDGPFVRRVATLYGDDEWKLYREDGTIRVTETRAAFEAAARPDVAAEFNNYVVEGRAEWIDESVTTYIIPVTPIDQEQPTLLGGGARNGADGPPGGRPAGPPPGGPRPPRGDAAAPGQSHQGQTQPGRGGVGVAFNGVNFDPPAPVEAILAAHTIAPFDDAGGHINPHGGYHYHAATGKTKEIAQPDGHAPMIGYALDGFGIYAHLSAKGEPSADLDECQGHTEDTRGYHYHVSSPGGNQILKGFRGQTGSVTVTKSN